MTSAAHSRPAPSPSPIASLRAAAADIKLAHSIFALPFALLASFMAATHAGPIDWPRFGGQIALIILCMFFARTVAMLANRLLDREIDARNPRTAGRAIPAGRLPARSAMLILLGAAALFMICCALFGILYSNFWPAILGLPVLVWIGSYGLFKRFTSLSHLYLGSSLAISPIAATIAIEPAGLAQPALWLIAAMVLCWVAGFDIIYALQDVEVDREQGLSSIPARLGEKRAMIASRLLHVIASGCLFGAIMVDERFDALFGLGALIVVILLIYEHATVARWGTTRLALAFFTINGIISCLLGAMGIIDILW